MQIRRKRMVTNIKQRKRWKRRKNAKRAAKP